MIVTCNPKQQSASRTLKAIQNFVSAYQLLNPDDNLVIVDVFKYDIQRIDADVLDAYAKIKQGQADQLTDEEKDKVNKIRRLAQDFASCDKYVFAAPMWNLGYPAEMKMFIDSVCVAGISFKYTANGPVGLLNNKKAMIITASGGYHHGKPDDFASPYLKAILNFMGITNIKETILEGLDISPENARLVIQEKTEELVSAAREF